MILDTSGDVLITSVKSAKHLYAVLRMDRLEAEFLAGREFPTAIEMVDFAQQMVNDGISDIVILARGADGSVFASATERFQIRPPKIPIQSMVGAGDTLKRTGLLAVSSASSAVQTVTAELCTKEVTKRLMTECVVTQL
ncbi:MAG: PfkB family carbohydrate kinase [Paracoccaceae bacterium]